MKTAALILAASLYATPSQAVGVAISFGAPPPLVEVQPGVQVVPDLEEEVYFADGAYWYNDGGAWYRSYDYRGGWTPVGYDYVPVAVYGMPRGHYRNWHPGYWHGPRPVAVYQSRPARPYYVHEGRGYWRGPDRVITETPRVNAPPRYNAPPRMSAPPRGPGPRGNGPHR